MDQKKRAGLLKAWDEWKSVQHEDVRDVELDLLAVLVPLLEEDGYRVGHGRDNERYGIDYFADREAGGGSAAVRIGIEFKLGASRQGFSAIERVANSAGFLDLDRLVTVSPAGFSKEAMAFAARQTPVTVELVDQYVLEHWIDRVTTAESQHTSAVAAALLECSRKIALLIAADPTGLEEIEWRDLERMLAAIFDELGFDVELTPPSKDKGRDIIIQFTVRGYAKRFLIEVKHWRSGKRVGPAVVTDFVEVVASERGEAGVVISSSGFTADAIALTEVERRRVRFGGQEKILSLCRTYEKFKSGLWSPPEALEEVVLAGTT